MLDLESLSLYDTTRDSILDINSPWLGFFSSWRLSQSWKDDVIESWVSTADVRGLGLVILVVHVLVVVRATSYFGSAVMATRCCVV